MKGEQPRAVWLTLPNRKLSKARHTKRQQLHISHEVSVYPWLSLGVVTPKQKQAHSKLPSMACYIPTRQMATTYRQQTLPCRMHHHAFRDSANSTNISRGFLLLLGDPGPANTRWSPPSRILYRDAGVV